MVGSEEEAAAAAAAPLALTAVVAVAASPFRPRAALDLSEISFRTGSFVVVLEVWVVEGGGVWVVEGGGVWAVEGGGDGDPPSGTFLLDSSWAGSF